MDFLEYIKPELLILVPVLYVIGMAIKKTALIADKLIPLAVGAAGILLSIIYVLATSDLGSPQAVAMAIFTALTQGVLVSGASVYANQIFKQFKNSDSKEDRYRHRTKIGKKNPLLLSAGEDFFIFTNYFLKSFLV